MRPSILWVTGSEEKSSDNNTQTLSSVSVAADSAPPESISRSSSDPRTKAHEPTSENDSDEKNQNTIEAVRSLHILTVARMNKLCLI